MTGSPVNADARRRNLGVVAGCVAFVAGMVGMAYAAVPLYNIYCKVTGYNGTTQRVEQASSVILDKRIRVEFDSNVANDLGWDFQPVQPFVDPRIGETMRITYKVTNRTDRTRTAQAVFNVTPMVAGAYFNKLECFCFTDVTLKPHETREMPVVFFVDPDIDTTPETEDLKVLTLSYTFYSHDKDKPVAATVETGKPKKL